MQIETRGAEGGSDTVVADLPQVWALTPGVDSPALRQAFEALCGPGEELWLVTDAPTIKPLRGRSVLCITSRRLVVADMQANPVVSVAAAALDVAYPYPTEIALTRCDSTSRAERKLTVVVPPEAAVMIKDRVVSLLSGTRPVVTPTRVRTAPEGFWLNSCVYLGGHGLPIDPQTPCSLVVNPQKSSVVAAYGARLAEFPTSALTAVEFGGPGRWNKGGGLIGGGFGLLGAAEGMLLASAINALTTRSGVTTIVRLEAGDAMTSFFLHNVYTPDQLQISLSWLVSAVRAHSRQATLPAAAAPSEGDLAGQLAKLGELKANGLLSDDEFTAAKAKLLGL